jgi:hypothetical protein
MVTLRNTLKVFATIIVSYLVGFILGSILGAVFGIFISFFIQDIISPQQAVSFSIFIALALGGLMSLFVSQVSNTLFETNINSFLGAIPGALIGLLLVVFVDGYFAISDMNNLHVRGTVQNWAATPIMPYCSTIGRQIGSIIFPLFGGIGIIREIIKSHLELQRNRKLMKDLPLSHWGLPETPNETHPLQAKPTTRSLLSLPSLITSTKGRLFSKAFIIACTIGIIVSILGWQILGWNSSIQFSKGLFWAGAMFAMYGYFNRFGEYKVSRNLATRYGETAGDMNIEERTKQWATEAENSFKPLPNIFLISLCLLGFSILISIIF